MSTCYQPWEVAKNELEDVASSCYDPVPNLSSERKESEEEWNENVEEKREQPSVRPLTSDYYVLRNSSSEPIFDQEKKDAGTHYAVFERKEDAKQIELLRNSDFTDVCPSEEKEEDERENHGIDSDSWTDEMLDRSGGGVRKYSTELVKFLISKSFSSRINVNIEGGRTRRKRQCRGLYIVMAED